MSQISRAVRAKVLTRLATDTTGFNDRLAAAMSDAGISTPPGFALPIDFTSGSRNFFQADILPSDLDTTTPNTYPAMTLFTRRSSDRQYEKYALFAGDVFIGINYFVSWMPSRVAPDFETFADCAEEAMVGTFNDRTLRDWSSPIVYMGEISLDRSRLTQDGANWLQVLQFSLTFEPHVMR